MFVDVVQYEVSGVGLASFVVDTVRERHAHRLFSKMPLSNIAWFKVVM